MIGIECYYLSSTMEQETLDKETLWVQLRCFEVRLKKKDGVSKQRKTAIAALESWKCPQASTMVS